MQILLADDDANTINLVSKYLINWRYEVVTARNGLEAIDIIEGSNPPPLIVLDWLMPVMDGIEVIKQVRKKEFSTPPYIILFTIRDEKQAIIEGLDAGANDYVTKPFDKDEFHARIRVGERFVELQNTLAQRIFELQEAMVQINTLRGILPICSFCHKIRNDQESWERIEKYITDHSEARFSHGICPECAEKHYPQFLKKT
jgi:DNA-binding response OmpR family regulator